MKSLISLLDRQSRLVIWIIAITLVGIIGAGDLLVGYEYSTTLFYILPVAIIAWFGSRLAAFLVSLLAATAWLLSDVGAGAAYSSQAIYVWNTCIRLGIFLLFATLLANFRDLLRQMEQTALTDYLTGALNRRGFQQHLADELARCRRFDREFSVAYLDADNFKRVNDAFGHAAGDRLLQAALNIIRDNLRKTDAVARLGGDEFSILFSETGSEAVKSAFPHIHECLNQCMTTHGWPVTFSIGVVTFASHPDNIEQILSIADEFMYSVKHSNKNNVVYKIWRRE
jgi:diguanylate cyclase (GGDEF)-like protein